MSAFRPLALATLLPAVALCAGCSGGGSYATVSGTVTRDGAPVDGAKVTFYSTVQAADQNTGVYSAITDSSGKYLIAAVGKEPGLPPGMYKVTVTKLDAGEGGLNPDEGFDIGQLEASGSATNLLPKDYETFATTKLSATLEPGKNEDVNFDLKGQASNVPIEGVP